MLDYLVLSQKTTTNKQTEKQQQQQKQKNKQTLIKTLTENKSIIFKMSFRKISKFTLTPAQIRAEE